MNQSENKKSMSISNISNSPKISNTEEVRIGQITQKWAESHKLPTFYERVLGSTNDWAKKEAFSQPVLEESLVLYLTDHQTAGRGRGVNTWQDASPGSSLLCSWSFAVDSTPQPTTTCLVGLGLYRACAATWPFLSWSLKAPNDLYLGSKKIAGILCETIQQGEDYRLIVGIGMNVTESPREHENSVSILGSLPRGVPLLGEDWIGFLERFLLEIAEIAGRSEAPLTSTEQRSLLHILNLNPNLTEAYTGVGEDGSLMFGRNRIEWL